MGRTKQRTVNRFLGRRKRRRTATQKANVYQCFEQNQRGHSIQSASASARKLECFGVTLKNFAEKEEKNKSSFEGEDKFFIVQFSSLAAMMQNLLCPYCKSKGVDFVVRDENTCGFAVKGALSCNECSEVIVEDYMCQRSNGTKSTRKPFEVNTRSVLAFRGIGCGFGAMKDWCSLMNIPCSMSKDTYANHQNQIHSASIQTAENVTENSVKAILAAYKDTGVCEDNDGILDIAVSFDGSWQKRGYSSHNGLACVIDLLTGLPIDFEVLSNYCSKCSSVDEDKQENHEWKEQHKLSCSKNFDGSSKSMEVECARHLWRRSVKKHKLRYTTVLCDGDSSAYDAIIESSPYGPNVIIEKEDCVNHVAKRMGTALRNLVEVSRAQKVPISGKGKLTQEKIKKIQNYYGRAIKDYADDISLLKKRIYAIMLHLSSSDEHPKHIHCPIGEKSWCFWQRAQAQSKDPGPHKEHDTLPAEIGKRLVPIFERLTDAALLKRCSRRKTQNPNESLHHLIWKLCPKEIFVGRKTLETAVALSVCQFSMGASFRQIIFEVLGVQPGCYLEIFSREKDKCRLRMAKRANEEESKKRRKALKFKTLKKEQKKIDSEGSTYAPGAFNEIAQKK